MQGESYFMLIINYLIRPSELESIFIEIMNLKKLTLSLVVCIGIQQ